ncbi:MerR family DNA-binding transcriptional regulator [Jiella endophytica]|uniref:MerR family DNA-binding transcriptional regulator n=1 Tax=Jiella endophytica TaxID=2558362 RepID=A0A4Y8R856_9HYPH|nr:MerR family DNA-binding transcriptional regulator [Jiella endophytica]TFF17580.1 MerR family DNA-binding transcriptional regulator [Jiella endophytica]
MPEQQTFSIKDLEKEFGLTPRTLRFYEERGLLHPDRRGPTRVYSVKDRERLKLITRFKSLGFPLVEVKQIVDLYEAPRDRRKNLRGLKTRLGEQREILLEQCRELEEMLRLMDETLAEVNGELQEVTGLGPSTDI